MVVLARPVRAIGGPMGPAVGPTGPRGPLSALALGAVGSVGPFGRPGATGPVGRAGLFADFIGPTGSIGPNGSEGWFGYTGPTGTEALSPDANYFRYYENTAGYKNFQPQGNYVGCKFLYTIKGPSFTIVMFTGEFTATTNLRTNIGIHMGGYAGFEAPPNPGDRSFGGSANIGGNRGNGFVTIIAPPETKIPFFIMIMESLNNSTADMVPSIFPVSRWYDLAAAHGPSGFDPAGGIVNKISCCIFEVPI